MSLSDLRVAIYRQRRWCRLFGVYNSSASFLFILFFFIVEPFTNQLKAALARTSALLASQKEKPEPHPKKVRGKKKHAESE